MRHSGAGARSVIFDCDNHYYEARRRVHATRARRRMQKRCVQWTGDGWPQAVSPGCRQARTYAVGQSNSSTRSRNLACCASTTSGNPRGQDLRRADLIRGDLEPQTARVSWIGTARAREASKSRGSMAIWLFPTLGESCTSSAIKRRHRRPLHDALTEGFNRWLDEDWGLSYRAASSSRCALPVTLADVDWACRASSSGRSSTTPESLVMRPVGRVCTAEGRLVLTRSTNASIHSGRASNEAGDHRGHPHVGSNGIHEPTATMPRQLRRSRCSVGRAQAQRRSPA